MGMKEPFKAISFVFTNNRPQALTIQVIPYGQVKLINSQVYSNCRGSLILPSAALTAVPTLCRIIALSQQ